MSINERVINFESYDIPEERRCYYFSKCRKKCDGYILQDECKRYLKYQKNEMIKLNKRDEEYEKKYTLKRIEYFKKVEENAKK